MAVIPPSFFDKLVAEACQILGLEDANKVVKDTDPTVKLCVRSAYTQAKKFCKRAFHKGSRRDYYERYYGPLELRSLPILYSETDPSVPLITVTVNGEAAETEDVVLLSDGRLSLMDAVDDIPEPLYFNIVVTATTGYEVVEENDTLYTGLLLQTVANYHRKDSLGLRETQGEKGISRSPADSGELIESAKQVLEALVYHGQGSAMDLGD